MGAHDRAGLERLLRYCARPPFALERLELLDAEPVLYRLSKPQREGTTALTLTPLELIDQLAALIPPPRRHRHRYHGVLAPNAPLREAVPGPFVLPPSRMTPSPLQRAASACEARCARSLRPVSGS